MSASFNFTGHVVVVTGGTQGIGAAIVRDFVQAGATVVMWRTAEAGDPHPLFALRRHPRLRVVIADVSTPEGRERLYFAAASAGRVSVLVNNVGTNVRRPTHMYSLAEYRALQATNLESAFFLCQMFFPQLRAVRGAVINVSSVSGQTSDGTGVVYHMTKAALDQMTRYLAVEWGPLDIRVNSVAPWFIRTPLTEPILQGALLDLVHCRTPLGRTGECHEVSQAVLFLASKAASYITGQVLAIDGALTCNGFNLQRHIAAAEPAAAAAAAAVAGAARAADNDDGGRSSGGDDEDDIVVAQPPIAHSRL